MSIPQKDKTQALSKFRNALIKVSSEQKSISTDSNTHFTINLASNGGVVDNVAGYAVKYISCPNVFNNIPSHANVFNLTADNTTPTPVTITAGQYSSLASLATELKTQIDAAITPDSVTITYPADKLVFTFTDGGSGGSYGFLEAKSTAASRLGLSADITAAAAFTAPNIVNLTGETEVYVHSRDLALAKLNSANGNFSVVDTIPMDVAYGGTSYFRANNAELEKTNFYPFENKKSLRKIDIRLRDGAGNLLTLPDNFHFTMILKFYYFF